MRADDWVGELQELGKPEWPRYLEEHSGLPGPRANLPLADAVAKVADREAVAVLLASGGEYPVMCAAAALGARADDAADEKAARELAADERWRVREGVAIGLQHLGDRALPELIAIVRRWVEDGDPLVQRAAVAALCEPRLLRAPEAAAAAVDACRTATARLAALPDDRRKQPDARTLRQALGYCWSVAVAADPGAGIPAFIALDTAQPDIAWIAAENRKKKRLASVLSSASTGH